MSDFSKYESTGFLFVHVVGIYCGSIITGYVDLISDFS